MFNRESWLATPTFVMATLLCVVLAACGRAPEEGRDSLVLALAVLGKNDDGSPKPLPAQMGVLTPTSDGWRYRTLDDDDSNVFHKVMAYGSEGVLSLGGTGAAVKLWRPDGRRERLWEADFGGRFSRMRDAEVGDIYGDGSSAIAVATHDQGVVAVLRPDDAGGFAVEELDRQPDTVVHEIELGDLDGDGTLEIYATPTAPNRVDGTAQPGSVVRYVPAKDEGRTTVADLGDRHAKEILVADIDGDGRDELYVSVEAVSGGKVEIRRYLAGTEPTEGEIVASLDDKLCRFLTVGDLDGDGQLEMVAATNRAGLWLLEPGDLPWPAQLIASDSSGFEHASIVLDLDSDGRDELYVASDNQKQIRRYEHTSSGWQHEVLLEHTDDLGRFTWNLMPVPTAAIPSEGVAITDVDLSTSSPAPDADETTEADVPRGLRLKTDKAAPGYTLYGPLLSDTTFLVDLDGRVVHSWKSDYAPAGSVYLLDNGNLLRGAREPDVERFKGGGQGGRIQEFSWDGELLWDWTYTSDDYLLHHDIEPLANGNILAIAWEYKSAEDALQAGRRPDLIPEAGLWPDKIVEIEPQRPDGGRIVWEWHMWDHLVQDFDPEKENHGVPSEHPELIDINGDREPLDVDEEELERLKALGYVPADAQPADLRSDLLHINAVAYNAELDQIALSTPRFNEIWLIDHSTTSEEAAGHSGGRWGKGGDLLYRWGNPETYGRGSEQDQRLFGQHDVKWVGAGLPGAGRLILFNNDLSGAEGDYSAAIELAPPYRPDRSYVVPVTGSYGPEEPSWIYEAPDKVSFYSAFISGVQRLPNGNTLICSGADGRLFEVTEAGEIVWEYWDPYSGDVRMPDGSTPHPVGEATHAVFRATRIAPDHPALRGLDLQPLDPQPAIAEPPPAPEPSG